MRQWYRAVAATVFLFALGSVAFGQGGRAGKEQGGKNPCSRFTMQVITPSKEDNYKTPVIKPDEGIDYKTPVINPCSSAAIVAVNPKLNKPDTEKKGNALSPRWKFAWPPDGRQKTPAEALTESLLNTSPKIKRD